jgi:hypothetical protein
MAHFAEISDGIVTQVIVVNNADCGGGEFPDSEPVGQAFIASIGLGGEWLQTSYHANFRSAYAGIGYTYDADADVFIAPQPYPSWTLDSAHDWQPPTAMPTDGKMYEWNEDDQEWVLVVAG